MQTNTNNQKGPTLGVEPWVAIESACQHLGISIPTMRHLIRDKRVKPKRLPSGHYRFRLSELDEILD